MSEGKPSVLHPVIKWAQRKEKVFLELQLRDVQDEKVDLTAKGISFSGKSGDKLYEFHLEFFDEIVPEASKWIKKGFDMNFVLEKKEKDKPYWVRLTKHAAKSQYIQCDWAKWVDEDDEKEEGHKGLEGLDEQNMQNFNDSDSDDEGPAAGKLADLEKDEPMEEVPKP